VQFDNIQEEFTLIFKEERAINNMLSKLPKHSPACEINDIQRVVDLL
jgi:hypothetical protein